MQYKIYENSIYIRFDKGDEVLETIVSICENENISTASFSGIGGCGEITVGTYNLEKHDYNLEHKKGTFEMLSINGNVTLNAENKPFVHAHAMFSYIDENNEMKLIGGHLKQAMISLTGEIVLSPIDTKIKRVRDKVTGLNVWGFEE